MRIKRKAALIAAPLLVLGATVVASAATAPSARASGDGDVQCVYGNNNVVGIWVQVVNGTSGWATRWNDGYGGDYYSYPAIDAGKTYSVHVGCSGTPQNWGGSFYSPQVTGYKDWICTYYYGNICYES